jgi:hypothetical protein
MRMSRPQVSQHSTVRGRGPKRLQQAWRVWKPGRERQQALRHGLRRAPTVVIPIAYGLQHTPGNDGFSKTCDQTATLMAQLRRDFLIHGPATTLDNIRSVSSAGSTGTWADRRPLPAQHEGREPRGYVGIRVGCRRSAVGLGFCLRSIWVRRSRL